MIKGSRSMLSKLLKYLAQPVSPTLILQVHNRQRDLVKIKYVSACKLKELANKAQELGLGTYLYKDQYYNFQTELGADVRFDHGAQTFFEVKRG